MICRINFPTYFCYKNEIIHHFDYLFNTLFCRLENSKILHMNNNCFAVIYGMSWLKMYIWNGKWKNNE